MEKDLIFDLGMDNGLDSQYYVRKGFRVVAVEPVPNSVRQVSRNLDHWITNRNLVILQIAIADQYSTSPFYINNENSAWSSLIKELGDRETPSTEIPVRTQSLEYLFKTHGIPYYLKIDVEGSELLVIQSLLDWKNNTHNSVLPKYVSVEAPHEDLLNLLRDCGYTKFKYVDQAELGETMAPRPSREGVDLSHTFKKGASGPFGEDTAGEWKSYEDILAEVPSKVGSGKSHLWYDLHATYDSQY